MTLGVWHFFGTQVDGEGFVKVLPNATVTVRRESDGGLAELESDIDGASPGLDNPFTAGSDGAIEFCADQAERYRIDIDDGSVSLTLRHQSVSSDLAAMRAAGLPINFSLAAPVASNALTIAFKTAAGDDPSQSETVQIPFRSATAGNGAINWRTLRAALSLTVPSGATLGHNSGLKQYICVYALDNGGTPVPAVSFKYFGRQGLASTTALSAAADSGTVMYADAAYANLPFACVGLLEVTEATAGTWATAPSLVHLAPFEHPVISFSAHKNGTAQTGIVSSTPTKITFPTEVFDNGGLFDAVTNHRWTPPPGVVRLDGAVAIASMADQSNVQAHLYKNGALLKRSFISISGVNSGLAPIAVIDECNGSDYYELWLTHNHGSNRDTPGSAADVYFMGAWSPGRS